MSSSETEAISSVLIGEQSDEQSDEHKPKKGCEVTIEEVKAYVQLHYPTGRGGEGYSRNLIQFLKTIVMRPINSTLLLEIPSKKKEKQNYATRRWEEISSLEGYKFVNWNHVEGKRLSLSYGQWILLSEFSEERPSRAISKKIVSEVFARDGHRCRRCGAKAGEEHHLFPDEMVRLHLGHKVPFIKESSNKKYKTEDFLSLCSKCNEGEKAFTLTLKQRVVILQKEMVQLQKEITMVEAELQFEADAEQSEVRESDANESNVQDDLIDDLESNLSDLSVTDKIEHL